MTTIRQMGTGMRWFHGIVEDLNDPLKLGRVKVRITGDHSDTTISTDDLPWATSLLPATSASLNGVGDSPTGLLKGSHVFGFYMDAHERQLPLIWGTLAKLPDMDQSKNDVSRLAREINYIKKTQDGPEPPSAYAAKYPHNHVTATESGHVVEFDDTPGHERIHVYHKSGTYVEVNEKGRIVTKSLDDHIHVVLGKLEIWVKGDMNLTVNGKVVGKAQEWDLTGDVKLTGNLTATGDVKAGNISLENHTHGGVQTGSGSTDKPNT